MRCIVPVPDPERFRHLQDSYAISKIKKAPLPGGRIVRQGAGNKTVVRGE